MDVVASPLLLLNDDGLLRSGGSVLPCGASCSAVYIAPEMRVSEHAGRSCNVFIKLSRRVILPQHFFHNIVRIFVTFKLKN